MKGAPQKSLEEMLANLVDVAAQIQARGNFDGLRDDGTLDHVLQAANGVRKELDTYEQVQEAGA